MLTTPFLTDLDSRAAVKGSRDPLGIQPIWTRLGRHVVGNLTTVSNSVRDFTTMLLGYHFAAVLAEDLGPGSELATFLKWEQLAAYARAAVNKDFAFRGMERVRRNLSESTRITLSADRVHQILGNQKIYGLWGLYTVAGRASGLVEGDPPRLAPLARKLVDGLYLPILEAGTGKDARHIRDALRRPESHLDAGGTGSPVLETVGRLLHPSLQAKERGFYRFHLLYGGPQDSTDGRQRQFAELLDATLGQEEFAWSPAMVGQIAKEALARGEEWHALAVRLARIRTSEQVLGPASALFSHLLGLDGKSVDEVAKRLEDAWGENPRAETAGAETARGSGLRSVDADAFGELRGEIAGDDPATGERWVGIAQALGAGEYSQLLERLVEQSKAVMAARGGPPWIENRQGILHVLFQEQPGALPKREEVAALWRSPYFLDSVRVVAATLKED